MSLQIRKGFSMLPILIKRNRTYKKTLLCAVVVVFGVAIGASIASAELKKATRIETSSRSAVEERTSGFEVISIRPSKSAAQHMLLI
jgi:hypothetical protein